MELHPRGGILIYHTRDILHFDLLAKGLRGVTGGVESLFIHQLLINRSLVVNLQPPGGIDADKGYPDCFTVPDFLNVSIEKSFFLSNRVI